MSQQVKDRLSALNGTNDEAIKQELIAEIDAKGWVAICTPNGRWVAIQKANKQQH